MILEIASLDQVSDVAYPFNIVVAQVKTHNDITYTATIRHARFVRTYDLAGFTWTNGRQFARWVEKFFNAFSYDNNRYPIEIYSRDLRFCEIWFDRHFMRKRETPVAI